MAQSVLATDGYKFSMAEAGWPLRQETFYYSHRYGGPQILPVDVESFVRNFLPEPKPEDYVYLAAHEYEMGCGFKTAITHRHRLVVNSIPRGSWFLEREPVFTLGGPSALVSWVEPLVLMLNFRIQVATLALTDREALAAAVSVVTCERQKEIVHETLDSVQVPAPSIRADPEGYFEKVRTSVKRLVRIVENPARIFEVGMRAATCLEQHEIALRACRDEGVTRTSNVLLAARLGMIPVGTMGHEHVQRYGSDEAAFRAMRDRRPYRSSFLLDTFDTLRSGVPAAYQLIAEDTTRGDAIRYDSGDKVTQYLKACDEARALGIHPVHILEDGFDEELTHQFEKLRCQVGLSPQEQLYGYGGYLVSRPAFSPLSRDRVSAVWKLTWTGRTPTMKFADEAGGGKESIPGVPVVFRRQCGTGPLGIVGQDTEKPPAGYVRLTGGSDVASPLTLVSAAPSNVRMVEYSPTTRTLVEDLRRERDLSSEALKRAGSRAV